MHNAYYIPFTRYNRLYNGSDNRLYRAYAASAVSLGYIAVQPKRRQEIGLHTI